MAWVRPPRPAITHSAPIPNVPPGMRTIPRATSRESRRRVTVGTASVSDALPGPRSADGPQHADTRNSSGTRVRPLAGYQYECRTISIGSPCTPMGSVGDAVGDVGDQGGVSFSRCRDADTARMGLPGRQATCGQASGRLARRVASRASYSSSSMSPRANRSANICSALNSSRMRHRTSGRRATTRHLVDR